MGPNTPIMSSPQGSEKNFELQMRHKKYYAKKLIRTSDT